MTDSRLSVAIVGASGHGVVALDAARRQGRCKVVGFLDSFKPAGLVVAGLPVLGHPEKIAELRTRHGFAAVFLGISNNWTRRVVHERLKAIDPDIELATIVHPYSAVADSARIGPGSLVLAGAVVNPGCVIGENCILSTKASLDHDSEMKAYASLMPGVTTAGNCLIGECTCVCIAATVAHRISIGDHTIVGAGAVVLDDIPDHSVAYGVPARVVRGRNVEEKHF